MYCVTLTTPTPDKVSTVLRRAKVQFQVVRTRDVRAKKGASNPAIAQRMYDQAANTELPYPVIANEFQVSANTLLRVLKNPSNYGVKGPPISRK